MKGKILDAIEEGIEAVRQLADPKKIEFIEHSAQMIAAAFQGGNKVLIAGNGGSLCDAAHFAEELTGFFRSKRQALPAIALNEPGHLTCVGNDIGFDYVFSRAIEALGRKGDVFIGLTTSGRSRNLIRAFECAKAFGLKTISFLGKGGGDLKGIADLELLIEECATSDRIQEAHMAAMHIMIEIIEEILFYAPLNGKEGRLLEENATLL